MSLIRCIERIMFFSVLLSILLVGCNYSKNNSSWKTVSHEEYGFSIDYPSRWNAQTYDVDGRKGDKEVKLDVYSSLWGDLWISVRQNENVPKPNLNDVIDWSNQRINKYQRSSLEHEGDLDYYFEEIFLNEDKIDEYSVMRRRYQLGILLREEVYIARETDMFIITLQYPETGFENYLDDFNYMVNSFSPLE